MYLRETIIREFIVFHVKVSVNNSQEEWHKLCISYEVHLANKWIELAEDSQNRIRPKNHCIIVTGMIIVGIEDVNSLTSNIHLIIIMVITTYSVL